MRSRGEEKGGRAGTRHHLGRGPDRWHRQLPLRPSGVCRPSPRWWGTLRCRGAWQPIAGAVVNPVSGETFQVRQPRRTPSQRRRCRPTAGGGPRGVDPWPTRWSPRASRMPRRPGPSRPDCSSNCSRGAHPADRKCCPRPLSSAAGEVDAYMSETSTLGTLAAGGRRDGEAGCLVGGPGGLGPRRRQA